MSDWSAKLTRPVRLKDDTVLLSLADARDCILSHFKGTTKNDALAHAIVLLMKAAEKKNPEGSSDGDGSGRYGIGGARATVSGLII